MSGMAAGRLAEERKNWRKDHPLNFVAKPIRNPDNSTNIMKWTTSIPGKEGTDWEGGLYTVNLIFPADYPSSAPTCKFEPPIYHPNVFSCGTICLSLLKKEEHWAPSVTIKQILLAIQDLLSTPNIHSPANSEASRLLQKSKTEYSKKIREQAKKFAPKETDDDDVVVIV